MADLKVDPPAEEGPPSKTLVPLFLGFLVLYYGVYSVFFSLRVSEYFRDILRHFAFVRRLF